MQETHRKWIDESIKNRIIARERKWTESVAFGRPLVCGTDKITAWDQSTWPRSDGFGITCELREMQSPYKANSNSETDDLRLENSYRKDVLIFMAYILIGSDLINGGSRIKKILEINV